MIEISQKPLSGKKGVILGIGNEHSIAYGCAQAFRALGADLAITYGHDKSKPYADRAGLARSCRGIKGGDATAFRKSISFEDLYACLALKAIE
jgi:enoyl-[acyl-carrier-protein] reductase (NADH)